VHRLGVFAEAYGAGRALIDVSLGLVRERCHRRAAFTEERAAAGEDVFVRLCEDGHSEVWRGAGDHVESKLGAWT
jgi:hypothetical protein